VVEKVATQASSRSKPAASSNSIGCRQAFRRAHGQWKIFPSNDWSLGYTYRVSGTRTQPLGCERFHIIPQIG
jgi:hypothetical protein